MNNIFTIRQTSLLPIDRKNLDTRLIIDIELWIIKTYDLMPYLVQNLF